MINKESANNVFFISLSPLVLQKVSTEICNVESSSSFPASSHHTARAGSDVHTGGATASQVKQSSFDYVAASEQLEKSYRSVMSAVKSSYNNVNASIGSVRAYQQAVVSAESALKATEAGYEVGNRTIIDVLDANRKLYDAKTKLAISRYSYIVNVATLKLNSGSLDKKEIIDIDNGLVNLR